MDSNQNRKEEIEKTMKELEEKEKQIEQKALELEQKRKELELKESELINQEKALKTMTNNEGFTVQHYNQASVNAIPEKPSKRTSRAFREIEIKDQKEQKIEEKRLPFCSGCIIF